MYTMDMCKSNDENLNETNFEERVGRELQRSDTLFVFEKRSLLFLVRFCVSMYRRIDAADTERI